MATRRIQKEFQDLQKEQIDNIHAVPIRDNLSEWEGTIYGPVGTPFEGGVYRLNIQFPSEYPHKPPKIIFRNRMFHPNIAENGTICLDILKENWSPVLNITKVLLSICSLLTDPNPASPLNGNAAREYTNNIENYNRIVKDYTRRYAI